MTDGLMITRTFTAPPERVYAMWTTPEHFTFWFGTEAVEVPLDSVVMDVRVGGKWRATIQLPDGHLIYWTGEYTEVDPPYRLAFTLTDQPSLPATEPVVVMLKEVSGGTEMTFRQPRHGFSDEHLERTREGYNGFFDAMEKQLSMVE
ncbi:SRPBCC family protein [Deinococcus humi]|uniref:Uncharacterized protein YndB with AHSA1/START domain n=1 Tax=Deinococcus humi TaxID=662880 RepID=A0A7W8JY48_9DEIO|nr:SRPBCC domain-containing protein [Deinococcus humi]MBB5365361.1 uncharacterized protein YndB with AHSA1/START domain [Deinococcus humi]GGO36171.1 activator of HSP90 ATPase [Deinococcus humi]